MRCFQLQDHNRNDDGHDAVAECFNPVRFHSVAILTRLQRTLCVAKKFYDLLDGIPVSRRRRDTQELLDLAEVTDRFHLASIQTQDEFFSDRNNFQQPLILRREAERQRRRRCNSFRRHADESSDVRS